MDMIELWKKFISQSHLEMLHEIEKCLLPSLAGEILYNVLDCESWENASFFDYESEINSISCWRNETVQVRGHTFKNITTYDRRYTTEFRHCFRKMTVQPDCSLEEFFQFFQFYDYIGFGDSNLPCTWADMFESTIKEYSPIDCLSAFLNKNCPHTVLEYFTELMRNNPHSEEESLWQYLYLSEDDDSNLILFFDQIVDHLFKILSTYTVGELKERYYINYQEYKKSREEAQQQYEKAQKQKEKLKQELEALGRSLLPEFNERLAKRVTLIKPELLRFAKDQKIWPELKVTLDSFSEKERAAIVYVSDKSKRVALQYPTDSYLNF